jgi:hypothetical protein
VSPQSIPVFGQGPDGSITDPVCGPGNGIAFVDYSPYDNYVDEVWCASCPMSPSWPFCGAGQ